MKINSLLGDIKYFFIRILFGCYLLWKTLVYYARRYRAIFLTSGLIVVGVAIWLVVFPPYQPEKINYQPESTVFIPRGASLRQIADILSEKGVLPHKDLFVFLGKISGYQNRIKAGLLKVPPDLPPWHLLRYLQHPRLAEIKVTFPEGISCAQMAGIVQQKLGLDSTRFMLLVRDSVFCHSLGVSANNLQGYLLPETYRFTYGMNEQEIIRFLVDQTFAVFRADSIHRQMEKIGMNMHQVLTLASIIEGEAMVDSERVLISSVYHNRLNRGWRLQADPTIQYILPGKPRRLLYKHLEIDSPYNTYRYRGLPPGPINNPGRKSILAALYPAKTGYMYFVASGDGGHLFSRTASEHARHKARFEQVRRMVRMKNRKR